MLQLCRPLVLIALAQGAPRMGSEFPTLPMGARIPATPEQAVPDRFDNLFEVVHIWTGGECDHLGIGISALGDVNGDGHPDFILGAMVGAYTFCFGPGSAQVISGKDGSTLYEVCGTDKEGYCGDAYGDTVVPIGDLDGDGAPDFAVGAWRYAGYLGYVGVYSGRTGRALATVYGNGAITPKSGPMIPDDCDPLKGEGFGDSVTSLPDQDGDGVADVAVGPDSNGTQLIYSGTSFRILGTVPGTILGTTGDMDGDGRSDLTCFVCGTRSSGIRIVSSSAHTPILEFEVGEGFGTVTPIGDVDADGYLDLVAVRTEPGARKDRSAPVRPLTVRWLSGKKGEIIHSLEIVPSDDLASGELCCSAVGDVDLDDCPDLFIQVYLQYVGSQRWLLSGKTASILAQDLRPTWTDGRRVVRLGDIDGDGRVEFLVSNYESQEGTRCGGAVYLAHLRTLGR
jgi:hypothetical protein